MNDYQNLMGHEAIEKIKELANEVKNLHVLYRTGYDTLPYPAMATRDVDDQGNIWFLSSSSSGKDQEVKHDADVQLIYSDGDNYNFMTVSGKAEVYKDKEKIKELWTPIANAWFTEGEDDPDVSVICVKPSEGYYWDTVSGKAVSMVKMVFSAITGKSTEENVEGTLQVQ